MARRNHATEGFRSLSRQHGIKIPVGTDFSVEECGLRSTYTTVFPLMNLAKKIILSNLPPFISDDILLKELSRHGQIVSAMVMLPSGCKSAKLRHVVSFRRRVYMIPNNENEELNIVMKFKVDGFDYTIFATTETMRCFGCHQEGHSVRNCPEKVHNEAETVQGSDDAGERTLAGTLARVSAGKGGKGVSASDARDGAPAFNVGDGKTGGVSGCETLSSQDTSEVAATSAEVCEEFGHTATPVGVQQEMDVDGMVPSDGNLFGDNESVFKIPHTKRKPKDSKGAKPKKMQANEKGGRESESDVLSDSDSGRESSDSSIPDGQRSNGYGLEQIRSFLEVTKGKRDVVVQDFFPDRELFLDSAKWLIRQRTPDGLRDTEVYRLQKLMQKIRARV